MIVIYTNKKGQEKKWVLQPFVISGLRRMSYRTPMRAAALTKARVSRGKYKCAKCENIVGKKSIAVDHKNPVVPVTGWDNFHDFIIRLFCPSDDLQILCRTCHALKSKEENAERRKHRKAKK